MLVHNVLFLKTSVGSTFPRERQQASHRSSLTWHWGAWQLRWATINLEYNCKISGSSPSLLITTGNQLPNVLAWAASITTGPQPCHLGIVQTVYGIVTCLTPSLCVTAVPPTLQNKSTSTTDNSRRHRSVFKSTLLWKSSCHIISLHREGLGTQTCTMPFNLMFQPLFVLMFYSLGCDIIFDYLSNRIRHCVSKRNSWASLTA